MEGFWAVLAYINEQLYIPCRLTPHAMCEEVQNVTYGAGRFYVEETSVRLLRAKRECTYYNVHSLLFRVNSYRLTLT